MQKKKRSDYYSQSYEYRIKKDPLRNRKENLARNYGLTLEEYEKILQSQGGVCKVCGGPPLGKSNQFHVDHDHVTDKIRGILCHFCNIALGMVRDDVNHLQKLIDYLKLMA